MADPASYQEFVTQLNRFKMRELSSIETINFVEEQKEKFATLCQEERNNLHQMADTIVDDAFMREIKEMNRLYNNRVARRRKRIVNYYLGVQVMVLSSILRLAEFSCDRARAKCLLWERRCPGSKILKSPVNLSGITSDYDFVSKVGELLNTDPYKNYAGFWDLSLGYCLIHIAHNTKKPEEQQKARLCIANSDFLSITPADKKKCCIDYLANGGSDVPKNVSCLTMEDLQEISTATNVHPEIRKYFAKKLVAETLYDEAGQFLAVLPDSKTLLIQYAIETKQRRLALEWLKEWFIIDLSVDVVQECAKHELTMQEIISLVKEERISAQVLGQLFLYGYQQKWNMQKLLQEVFPSVLVRGVSVFDEARYLELFDAIKEYVFSCTTLTMAERAKKAYEMACLILSNFSANESNRVELELWAKSASLFESAYQDDSEISKQKKEKALEGNKKARELLKNAGLIDSDTVNHYEVLKYLLTHGSDFVVSSYFARYAEKLEQAQRNEIIGKIKLKLSPREKYRAFMGYRLTCSSTCCDVPYYMIPQFCLRGEGNTDTLGHAILKHNTRAMYKIFSNFDFTAEYSLREQFLVLYCLVFEGGNTEKRRELLAHYALEDSDLPDLKKHLPLALVDENSDAANCVATIFKKKDHFLAEAYWRLRSGDVAAIGDVLENLLRVAGVSELWKKSVKRNRPVQEHLLSLGKRLFLNWQKSSADFKQEESLRSALFILFGLLVEVYGEDITLKFSKKNQITFDKALFDSIFCEGSAEKLREFTRVLVNQQAGYVPFAPTATTSDTASIVSLDEAATCPVPRENHPNLEIVEGVIGLSTEALKTFGFFTKPSAPPLSETSSVFAENREPSAPTRSVVMGMAGADVDDRSEYSIMPSEAESLVLYQPQGKVKGRGFQSEEGKLPDSGSDNSSELESVVEQGKKRVACVASR